MNVRIITLFLSALLFILIGNNFFHAVTEHTIDGDSKDYHIPLAERIIDGTAMTLPLGLNTAMYYPGSSEAILSLFILADIPLRLYNFFSWLLLIFVLFHFAKMVLKNSYHSYIFAITFATVQSVQRHIFTQGIDIWMAIYFFVSVILLENPKKSSRYFIFLGIILGMLLGSKSNGFLFLGILMIVYFNSVKKYLSLKYTSLAVLCGLLSGGIWYVRNIILYKNPLYPANIPFFKGADGFPLQDMMFWKTPFIYSDGIYKIAEAMISEYLFISVTIIIFMCFIILVKMKKIIVNVTMKRLINLTFLMFLISLLFPIPTTSIISNMRYLYPLFILTYICTYYFLLKLKYDWIIVGFSLVNVALIFSHIGYQPKLFILCGIFFGITLFALRDKVNLFKV